MVTVGLILLLGTNWITLLEVGEYNLVQLLLTYSNGHASSGVINATFIQTHNYVQDSDKSKSIPITSQLRSMGEWDSVRCL
ncbi:MAG: hypothetical protein HRU40_20550 [Saprospiraceae bacterium]|nr:hypothetical protein [Saprospiraceae bacterium]